MFSYNLLAIQRHMKVLGIFCRLSIRDKKSIFTTSSKSKKYVTQ